MNKLIKIAIIGVSVVAAGYGLAWAQARANCEYYLDKPLTSAPERCLEKWSNDWAQPTTKAAQLSFGPADITTGVNGVRQSSGLPALADNALLDASAAAKAGDMCQKGYWAHGDWTSFIAASGYAYSTAGENLAFGSDNTPVSTYIKSWVDSPEHFANMTNSAYTEIGSAVVECPGYQGVNNGLILVNHFGAPVVKPPAKPAIKSGCTQ